MTGASPPRGAQWLIDPASRALTAVGLLINAVLHLELAANYQLAAPAGIGQGNLFRIEAAFTLLAMLLVLARGGRTAYLVAFGVAAAGLGALLLYRYCQVPAVGPIPAMYEPVWFFKKAVTAVAEAVAASAALTGFLHSRQSVPARAANH